MSAFGSVTSREDFARALSDLRARSGLSVRRLGKLLGVPPSTIHGWFTGRHLPYPRDDELFRRLLRTMGVDETDSWWEVLDRLRRSRVPIASPYRGLSSYRVEDAHLFHGRDALTERTVLLIEDVRGEAPDSSSPSLVFLVGASGSGKSSLLHAGVQAALRKRGSTVVALRPGSDPIVAWEVVGESAETVLIDQFEEVFTQCSDNQRQQFFDALLDWSLRPGKVAVAAVRADFFAAVASGPLHDGLANQVFVGPMTWAELEDCILRPAQTVGLTVADDLLALLQKDFMPVRSSDATHARGALPLLSYLLWRISEGAKDGRLTATDYLRTGGLEGTIEQAAEEAFSTLDKESRAAWRRFIPLLVNVGSDGTVTRRLVVADQVASVGRLDDGLDAALAAFVDARLVTVSEDGVELTHEALLSAWSRLREWIAEDRSVLSLRSDLTTATRIWLEHGRDVSTLVAGARLSRLSPWTEPAYQHLLGDDERTFLETSVAQARHMDRLRRRSRRNLRILAGTAAVLAFVAGGLAVAASRSAETARQARDAELSRRIALRADTIRDTDPLLAGQLAMAAYRIAPTAEARASVLEAAVAPRSSRLLGGPGSTALAASPDGSVLAVGSEADSSVQLVDRSGGSLTRRGLIQLDPGVAAYVLAFSRDGRTLAVGSTDGAVRWWDVADLDAPTLRDDALTGLAGAVFGVAPCGEGWLIAAAGEQVVLRRPGSADHRIEVADGRSVAVADTGWFAVGTADGSVWIFDREGMLLSRPGDGLGSEVTSVAVSPDSSILVAGTKGRAVFVWNVSDPAEPRAVDGPAVDFSSWVNTLAFSTDGKLVAAGSSDRTIRVWSTEWTDAGAFELPDAVTGLAFLPDGSLATTAVDGNLRVWDSEGRADASLGSNIWMGGYDSDGKRFAAFGDAAAVWDTSESARPQVLAAGITPPDGWEMSGAGAISPNGSVLALGGADGEVALIDVANPISPQQLGETLRDATGLIEYIAFLRNGTVLAVGGDDGAVRFYDISVVDEPHLLGHPFQLDGSIAFAFAVNGQESLMAVTGSDDKVHLVDISDLPRPVEVAVLGGFEADTTGVAFSPDGRLLAAASNDEYVIFWDVTEPATPAQVGEPLEGPHATPFTLDWSADGNYLAASATDHSVWVWRVDDARHPELHVALESPSGPMHVAALSPDGATVAGAGADATVYFWPLDARAAAAELCAAAGDGITPGEWDAFRLGHTYFDPCAD